MVIRDALPGDARDLAEISVDGWRTAYVGIVPDEVIARQRVEPLVEYFGSEAAVDDGMRTLVVEIDGGVVGFAHTGPFRAEPGESEAGCELWGMYIHSTRRCRGLGSELMQAVFDHFRSIDCEIAYLWVLRDNKAARRFYEGAGWQLDRQALRTEPLPQVRYLCRMDTEPSGSAQ